MSVFFGITKKIAHFWALFWFYRHENNYSSTLGRKKLEYKCYKEMMQSFFE